MNPDSVLGTIQTTITEIGLKIIGALILWLVGRWLISIASAVITRTLKNKLEPTVSSYIVNTVAVLLNITLIVAVLGYFGVQTTTFAALLAAAGLAVGMAWSGLLANFAAGAFLVVLRPFKVGDMISGGGVTGVVQEIGIFVTTVNTADNIRTFVSNNKIFSDNIQNFSSNPFRRVDCTAQIAGGADYKQAIQMLKDRLAQIPNISAKPAPDVEILTFTPYGPVLAVRPYCANEHYWQVFFDTNRIIREVSDSLPAPTQGVTVRNA